MKTKIMALILAVGLGVTGVAVTAQAAEKADTCTHSLIKREEWLKSAVYWNGDSHKAAYGATYSCVTCGKVLEIVEIYEERMEPHDYEQTYFGDGRVMSYCNGCGYYYFW